MVECGGEGDHAGLSALCGHGNMGEVCVDLGNSGGSKRAASRLERRAESLASPRDEA